MRDPKAIFEPRNVVLIGSSALAEEFGMASPQLFENVAFNMKKFFKGKTFILDAGKGRVTRNLAEACRRSQLAVIALPPRKSISFLEKGAALGVKTFVLIAGGYSDKQRSKLLELKAKYGIRILGPNSIMGVLNTANGLNTTFARDTMPNRGNIGVVCQSGGVGASLLDWACFNKIGISKLAFVGDKIDIDDADLLRYLGDDKDTKVICLYIEGVKRGDVFLKVASRVVEKKPILVLKGGATEESAQRAKSHTASIVGSDEVFDAVFKKAGVIRVGDIEELMGSAVALSKQPPMLGDNVAVVSNVGGPSILAADAVVRHGLKLALLSEKTRAKIEERFSGVDATNPIDLVADARGDRYSGVLRLVLADHGVDGVLVINMLKSTFFEPKDAEVIPKAAARYPDKPVVDVPMGGEDFSLVQAVLGPSRIPLYDIPEKAVKALKALRSYGAAVARH